MKQYGFHFDGTRCVGCKACQIACNDYYHLPEGISFRQVYEYTGGTFEENSDGTFSLNVWSYPLSQCCNHCVNPVCVTVCPTTAMHKDMESGFVWVDHDKCIGCQYCVLACPYGVPRLNAETGMVDKCDGCRERVSRDEMPVCVEACPQRALDFMLTPNLAEEHGYHSQMAPLPDPAFTRPNLAIEPNRNAKPTNYDGGFLGNAEEVL